MNMTCDFLFGSLVPFSWNGFWWLFRWSLGFLYVWPLRLITLALVANLVAALVHRWPFHHERWKKEYWLAFLSLLFIPATIAMGVVGWIDPTMVPRPNPSALLVWTNNGLFIASIMLGIFWAYRMKGLRWFALALALIQLWILLGAGFTAGMAISGNWL
ncbi:MAG TPA: hypothetical protein VL975_00685 [Candidatus Micrarchaeia archaeon]|nr:hypothetical protein [Candidatus Micrarchaeia archaeon]